MNESETIPISEKQLDVPPDVLHESDPVTLIDTHANTNVDNVQSRDLVKEVKKIKKKKKDQPVFKETNSSAVTVPEVDEVKEINADSSLENLQNGTEHIDHSVVCGFCELRLLNDEELTAHVRDCHFDPPVLIKKPVKKPRILRQRVRYYCIGCKGKSFGSKEAYHSHLLDHVSMPRIRLTRLKEPKEERPESPVFIPSGRLQVAVKRVTASCIARSPLKFRLKLRSDQSGRDSFKLVKSSTEKIEKFKGTDTEAVESNEVHKPLLGDGDDKIVHATEIIDIEDNGIENVSVVRDVINANGDKSISDCTDSVSAMVEATKDQCSIGCVEELQTDSPRNIDSAEDSINRETVTGETEEAMRQIIDGDLEMENVQHSSPSVIQRSHENGQILNDKNTDDGNPVNEMNSEFIPLEPHDKDRTSHVIDTDSQNKITQVPQTHQEDLSEASILCEACGETIVGDQTALEDHCLCQGHYKCPICHVACASTDALAVHSQESHPNEEAALQSKERKKKGMKNGRRKHSNQTDKGISPDSQNELSNSSSSLSPSDVITPPISSITRPPDSSVSPLNIRVCDASQLGSTPAEERVSPAQASNLSPPQLAQANVNPPRSSYGPHVRPLTRISESMPPPLIRPPQSGSIRMPDPMQPPPALYRMPSTSHGMNNSHLSQPVSTVSHTGYARAIPASGYQTDPQTTHTSSHMIPPSSAMNSRYQPMHPGYPPVSQPTSAYASYAQSVQMQQAQMLQHQRFPVGPPPPYPNPLHHLQQAARVGQIPPSAYGLSSAQQQYGQSLLKSHLEQTRMSLPQPSAILMPNLQQEHYQQQQVQQQIFQQAPNHQMLQAQQQEQNQAAIQSNPKVGQKRKVGPSNSSNIRLQHQNALQHQKSLQSQLQSNSPAAKQRRIARDNIGIPSKQTDSDCEIIAVQQRGEGVPVIQSIQGSSSPSANLPSMENELDNTATSLSGSSQSSSESTIHLTDSITLSVRPPQGSSTVVSSAQKGSNASAVASILATRGITVTPASGSVQHPRTNSNHQKTRPSPPLNRGPVSPPNQSAGHSSPLNNAVSISHASRSQVNQMNDGFAMPAPVGAQRVPQRQQAAADRPPRPPTVDLTEENINRAQASNSFQCRLCDRQFPTAEVLQSHMQLIHHTKTSYRCTICNSRQPSQQALATHMKRVHKYGGSNNQAELVIPLLDLRNTAAVSRLSSLGIKHVISLSQLGMNSENGSFCLPIMSLDVNNPQRNNTIGGLISLGTSAVLPIGPVKSLPNVQTPQVSSPQTVPVISRPSVPPPLAPLSAQTSQQYVQAPHSISQR